MADYREFDATNEPDTCLWCGRKLRYKTHDVYEQHAVEVPAATVNMGGREFVTHDAYTAARNVKVGEHRAEKAGSYEDGHFCGLRCGYLFGVALADLGRKLQPRRR